MTTLELITGSIGTCKYLLCNLIGINSKVNINALLSQKIPAEMLDRIQNVPLDTKQLLKFKRRYLSETHLILDIETTFSLQKPHCKNFWWNYNKSESCKPYLGNKKQKLLFLVVSLSDVHMDFKIARPEIQGRKSNFVRSFSKIQ